MDETSPFIETAAPQPALPPDKSYFANFNMYFFAKIIICLFIIFLIYWIYCAPSANDLETELDLLRAQQDEFFGR